MLNIFFLKWKMCKYSYSKWTHKWQRENRKKQLLMKRIKQSFQIPHGTYKWNVTCYFLSNGTKENVHTSPIKARCTTGNCIDIYIICHWLILQIELQNLLATPHIWTWDNNLVKKATELIKLFFTALDRTFRWYTSPRSGKYMLRWLTCLSNLPGLVSAGSRISGKFVAAITIIPCKIKDQLEARVR